MAVDKLAKSRTLKTIQKKEKTMDKMVLEKLVRMADSWTKKVWKKTATSWEIRKQDHNYRRFVARPAMLEALKQVEPIKNGIFLDLGCGDGSEMRYIRKFLAKSGSSGTFFGFDLQKSLIDIAQSQASRRKPIQEIFDHGDLPALIDRYNFSYTTMADRLFSTFLLQELSDARKFFRLASSCIKDGGQGIFLLLHPSFGRAMYRKKVVRVQRILKTFLTQPGLWRWAAKFPIVEEKGRTFYVPYFHRELEDYLELAQTYFSDVRCIEGKPSDRIARRCQREHLSPFYDHPGNVYYPEIITTPSSLIFLVRK